MNSTNSTNSTNSINSIIATGGQNTKHPSALRWPPAGRALPREPRCLRSLLVRHRRRSCPPTPRALAPILGLQPRARPFPRLAQRLRSSPRALPRATERLGRPSRPFQSLAQRGLRRPSRLLQRRFQRLRLALQQGPRLQGKGKQSRQGEVQSSVQVVSGRSAEIVHAPGRASAAAAHRYQVRPPPPGPAEAARRPACPEARHRPRGRPPRPPRPLRRSRALTVARPAPAAVLEVMAMMAEEVRGHGEGTRGGG